MKRGYKLFVRDILDAIDKIEQFVGDISYQEFIQDDKTSTAVVKKIEIIGEAIKNIPPAIRAKYRNIPWRDIVGMRNKISHGYFGIDYEIVWAVIKQKLPVLKAQVTQMLKEIEEG
jgi:uncharacterized protein with HEPN domain